jgi:hypothetical protein
VDEDIYQKNTITRSFSRKINLGNYESADFFESRTIIVPNGTSILEYHQISKDLLSLITAEVELSANEYKQTQGLGDGDWKAFSEVIDSVGEGRTFLMSEYEKLSPNQKNLVNGVKKAYKRSPLYKEAERSNNIENQQSRK